MARLASRAVGDLGAAARSVGDEQRRLIGGANLRQHGELPHLQRRAIVLGFISEASCHAAAARLNRLHLYPRHELQCLLYCRHGAEGFLMAMAVEQNAPVLRWESELEAAGVRLASQKFLEEQGVRRERAGPWQHHLKFVAEGKEAGWLESDDWNPALT